MKKFYFDLLISKLRSTALWRQGMALKFPEDSRNGRSAELLARLASTSFEEVAPDLWEAAKPILESENCRDVLQDSSGAVGFRVHPADFNDYLAAFIDAAEAYRPRASVGASR